MSSGAIYSELNRFLKYLRELDFSNFCFSDFLFRFSSLKSLIDEYSSHWLVNTNELVWYRTICEQRLHPHLFNANRLLTRINVSDLKHDLIMIRDHFSSIDDFLNKYPAIPILVSFTKNISAFLEDNEWESVIHHTDSLNRLVFRESWSDGYGYVNHHRLSASSHDFQHMKLCDIFRLSKDKLNSGVFTFLL
uniref:p22 protein n=1 Tax=Sweet potato chlorotic stunt virus TaxID=81931 RepID=L7N903_9CLOS|nr:p22 protein [Sweet potato chlorotic stunt virus]ADQ42506.1 p22 protein [Sweet potato chlorotic stunt virus]ADQ42510.1 p22 protein [Sweet potato chlorotic stunt virus]ADQ42594.1 p22 protein [Sweet potato chlorotic stunt virus]